jgi:ABC-type sugar transport system ATPase subunit
VSFLTLRDLRKTYPGGTAAVKGVDLSFAKGEFVVLLGPSGCGKTTTLRMVAGLELPTGGSIHLDDREVTRLSPAERDIGFVFQFYALYPHLRVRDNIEFPLRCAGLPVAERQMRLTQVVERMGLTLLLERFPAQLSGGDQQRVGLARAMVRNPRLFLMDEPLGTLDADRRHDMQEFIRAQQQTLGVTTLYVTHDQEEAMSLADRVVVMRDGLVQQCATPGEVYDRPANLFVAHFVGSPGMNQINGEVQTTGQGAIFVADGETLRLPLPATVAAGPAVLGVRAEFVLPDPEGPLAAKVLVSEFLGAARLLHLATPAGKLVARVSSHGAWRPGDSLRLSFDAEHLRVFDRANGQRRH